MNDSSLSVRPQRLRQATHTRPAVTKHVVSSDNDRWVEEKGKQEKRQIDD